jgi:hypothetical protein
MSRRELSRERLSVPRLARTTETFIRSYTELPARTSPVELAARASVTVHVNLFETVSSSI